MPVHCKVTHNGKALAGVTVTFVPEPFLGGGMQKGTGTTSSAGVANIVSPYAADPAIRGMSPGFYRVEITKSGEKIPAKYNTQTTLVRRSGQRFPRPRRRVSIRPEVLVRVWLVVGGAAVVPRGETRPEIQKRLGTADKDRPAGRKPIGQAEEEVAPPGGVEVNRHVAAEDHVERAHLGERLQEIAALEGDHRRASRP